MKISEIFGPTIQGEVDVGKRVVFIRTSGCNLIRDGNACKWCDTMYAETGKDMSIEAIIKAIKDRDCKSIVVSGGEPTYQLEDIRKLVTKLREEAYEVSIETNGTLYDETTFSLCNKISCSPKKQQVNLKVLENLVLEGARFKFVYDESKWWERVVNKLKIPYSNVYIMPEGKTKDKQEKGMKRVVDYCIKKGYNFTPRMHVLIWDNKRAV